MDSATPADFAITHSHQLACGEFALDLELGGELELAMVEVVDRADCDEQVRVLSCTSAAAQAWLEDASNWPRIAQAVADGQARAAAYQMAVAKLCRVAS